LLALDADKRRERDEPVSGTGHPSWTLRRYSTRARPEKCNGRHNDAASRKAESGLALR